LFGECFASPIFRRPAILRGLTISVWQAAKQLNFYVKHNNAGSAEMHVKLVFQGENRGFEEEFKGVEEVGEETLLG